MSTISLETHFTNLAGFCEHFTRQHETMLRLTNVARLMEGSFLRRDIRRLSYIYRDPT
jgi:hypothetical protein